MKPASNALEWASEERKIECDECDGVGFVIRFFLFACVCPFCKGTDS